MFSGIFLFLNMSGGEMIIIFLVFLMLFGSKNIPDIARTLGRAARQFKDATGDIQRDIEQGTRDFRNRIDQETRQIKDQVSINIDVMANESSVPSSLQTGQGIMDEDVLANSSSPAPASVPALDGANPPSTKSPSVPVSPTEAPAIDIPVLPTEEKPSL